MTLPDRTDDVSAADTSLGSAVLVGVVFVTAAATLGSLYFSLGLGLVPCSLCWYQRILMYPLPVVVGVAALERRPTVYRTVLPLSMSGTLLAAYHSYLQVAPRGGTCTLGGGCTSIQYPMLGGLLTIPRLSFVAFSLTTLGMGVLLLYERR